MNADVKEGNEAPKLFGSSEAPVVFLQHGLFSIADTWIYNKPEI